METTQIWKLVTAIGETILAIPVLGGIIVLSSAWSALGILFALHIVTLIFAVKNNKGKAGSILGIVTNILGWIPILGWILHIASAVLLWIGFAKNN